MTEPASDTAPAAALPAWVTHPGLEWLDECACSGLLVDANGNVDRAAIRRFFVAAGHIIDPEQKRTCVECPVRRECLIHSFLGDRGGPVSAGYFAGFSYGQRHSIPFDELYAAVEAESRRYRTDG